MATAEECRTALESLTHRIARMEARDRAAHLLDRTLSCRVPDLGVRFTANSDVVVGIAGDPASFMRAWLSGRLKVHGSVFDLLHLRKLM
jgi:hypothetical protein